MQRRSRRVIYKAGGENYFPESQLGSSLETLHHSLPPCSASRENLLRDVALQYSAWEMQQEVELELLRFGEVSTKNLVIKIPGDKVHRQINTEFVPYRY